MAIYKIDIEDKLKKKQAEALKAKEKGMLSTYSKCMMEISVLKANLQKQRTCPNRK